MSRIDWIAADWGTSHLRAWAMAGTEVVAEAKSVKGMGKLTRDEFEPALLELIAPWLGEAPMQVIACGMVGARQGWVEAPYATVPCLPVAAAPMKAPVSDPRLDVRIVAGLRQDKPADVMRGEETQIAGFVALNPNFDGVICLPGTHTKWAHISAGEVVSFQTFMTGEMFSLLGTASVLRHSVGAEGWDDDAFVEALDEAQSRPERMAARLFGLRAEALLHDQRPESARARLSGFLIGAELAAARPYWLGQQVAVIGAPAIAAPYLAGLTRQGLAPIQAAADLMTRAGLMAARKLASETPS
ncbi:2-dehydro-3-deoxygalactonokinase [Fluviibacterium sp. S390]|uniref:2-dehydro-3-deoxygalactonokinase n=1 Tax=Fluviibacterium sp. S390 TaxID=3415139 RepID=UPI003C7A6856